MYIQPTFNNPGVSPLTNEGARAKQRNKKELTKSHQTAVGSEGSSQLNTVVVCAPGNKYRIAQVFLTTVNKQDDNC